MIELQERSELMTNREIIEQLENAIELIKQDGKDWLDDRDIPILEACIKSLTALDKIRDQLKSNLRGVEIALEVLVENDPLRPKMEGAKTTLEDCLELIDKAETEDKE